ncbi:tRNA glutamyl-Q(34) synthetase GluQRS [Silanimonas lenta]|uniref:tRNA glutamyl-Q(34) synthetase GluQRS n=1 Tax=Silanimonas lenta TaxID=265429 RepID=UPI0004186805|nr:tRNA glutamyl-Q(34) synthetase GluQRS [Silanimonas lenta]
MTPSPAPSYVGRFAPSPTGPLHWGSVLAAFGSWLHARHHGGRWLVRIEDLDPPRERPGAAQAQLATLARLGLHPDGEVLFQSRRHARYREALDTLLARGLAFPCLCSRSDLAASGGIHRACVPVPEGARRTRSFRLRVDDRRLGFDDAVHGRIEQDLRHEVGDVVLRRADGYWAYQLAVVVDDADQGISHVVRGADLLDSTPRQIALQQALGFPTPRYLHLPLWCDAQGRKLSKSEGAEAVDGQPPLAVLRRCWRALGQPDAAWPDLRSPEAAAAEAAKRFDPARIPRTLPPGI